MTQMISGIVRTTSTFDYAGGKGLHIDMEFGKKQRDLKDRSVLNSVMNSIPRIRLTVWKDELVEALLTYPASQQLTVVIDDVLTRVTDNGNVYYNANALYAFEPEEGEEIKGPSMAAVSSPAVVQSGDLPV